MARKKLSEFRAKTILCGALNIQYSGVEISPNSNIDESISSLDDSKLYVVKVDQGVKKRGKQGLIKLKVTSEKLKGVIEEFRQQHFEYFLVEEFIEHDQTEERYLAIERVREGLQIHFS